MQDWFISADIYILCKSLSQLQSTDWEAFSGKWFLTWGPWTLKGPGRETRKSTDWYWGEKKIASLLSLPPMKINVFQWWMEATHRHRIIQSYDHVTSRIHIYFHNTLGCNSCLTIPIIFITTSKSQYLKDIYPMSHSYFIKILNTAINL